MRPSEQVETVGCLVGWLLCWLSYFSHTTCSFSYVITIVAVVAAAFVVVVDDDDDDDDDDDMVFNAMFAKHGKCAFMRPC